MLKALRAVSLVLITLFSTASFAASGPKVALIFDRAGKDDKSFNASAYAGALEAQTKLGATIKYVEASEDNSYENFLKSFSGKDFDLIVSIGGVQADAVKKVAAQFPAKKYLIVDGEVPLPNVSSVLFQEHEGSFLVGAAAALASKTGVVGFIGGMDIPLIRRFEMGYAAGAKHVNPKVKVISNYIGVTGDAWHNPPRAKELALAQIASKADVIFHAAGSSGLGLFDAAEEKKIFAIGVDSNQNWVKPGRVLTSMLKRVDLAVFNAVKAVKEGQFKAGTTRIGVKDQGIDWALDTNNQAIVTPEMKKKVEAIKADIVAGKIKVPDYYTSAKR